MIHVDSLLALHDYKNVSSVVSNPDFLIDSCKSLGKAIT